MPKKQYYILKLESYSGEYSSLQCDAEGQDFMYCICLIIDKQTQIIDCDYSSRGTLTTKDIYPPEAWLKNTKSF